MPKPSAQDEAASRLKSLTYRSAELVFGLVGAVGTDLDRFQAGLIDTLRQYGYTGKALRLSQFLGKVSGVRLKNEPEYQRILTRMKAGTKVRKLQRRGDIPALAAVASISRDRARTRSASEEAGSPFLHTAHILNSLKHPHEVETLRRIYGSGFFLLGVYSSTDDRLKYLTQTKGMSDGEAKDLMSLDEDEGEELGQSTRDTFHRADVFVDYRAEENTNTDLQRFLDLLFGDPFITPSADEQWMFTAYSSALRSGQLSRQVGAAVVSAEGDLLSVGANDVPRFRGGLYWPGKSDRRDHVLGYDSNDAIKGKIVEEIAGKTNLSRKTARKLLKGTAIADITEFGRATHAEMEAVLSCARIGASPRGATLYTTTFPCHNCAKHIIAVGITRVVYIEPYAKSKAQELFSDSLVHRSRNRINASAVALRQHEPTHVDQADRKEAR